MVHRKRHSNWEGTLIKASIEFKGCQEADWFSLAVEQSIQAVLQKNYSPEAASGEAGFITASVDGRPWSDTMWSRDAGTFVRELVYFGAMDEAKNIVQALFNAVELNDHGYFTFPEYVYRGEKKSGKEMDGTMAILMAAIALLERLPPDDAFAALIRDFIVSDRSPIRYILQTLASKPFIEGSGEFGPGCYLEGSSYNVVQNALVVLGLEMVSARLRDAGNSSIAALKANCLATSTALKRKMYDSFINDEGGWHWCLNPVDGLPDYDVMNEPINRGTTLINGVFSYSSDVYGFLPGSWDKQWLVTSVQTFWKLLLKPKRFEQFFKHGIWTQFDEFFYDGYGTSPSYGHGYALQIMLLLDRPELYTRAVNWLARATVEPGYAPDRASRYWFLERYYSPDVHGRPDLEEGCGALNLVNVSEPLKAARLMAGLDDSCIEDVIVRLLPRLPFQWTSLSVRDMPVRTRDGHTRISFVAEGDGLGGIKRVYGEARDALPAMRIRLSSPDRHRWVSFPEGLKIFDTGNDV